MKKDALYIPSILIVLVIAGILLFTQSEAEREANQMQEQAEQSLEQAADEAGDELAEAENELENAAEEAGDEITSGLNTVENRLEATWDATQAAAVDLGQEISAEFTGLANTIQEGAVFTLTDQVFIDGGYYFEVEDFEKVGDTAQVSVSLENDSNQTVEFDPNDLYLVDAEGTRYDNLTLVDTEVELELLSGNEYIYTLEATGLPESDLFLLTYEPNFASAKIIYSLDDEL